MNRALVVMCLLGALLPSRVAAQYTPEIPDSLKAEADSIIVWLNAGKCATVAAKMHYPPMWSKKQRAEDEKGLAEGLRLITGNLGRLVDYGAFTGVTVNYEVSAAGGDIPYWEKVSPFRTRDRLYQGVFERFGKGFVVVRFAELNSTWDVQAVVFWLDPAEDGARDRAIDITCELARENARQHGEKLPPNLRQMISSAIPDLSAANR